MTECHIDEFKASTPSEGQSPFVDSPNDLGHFLDEFRTYLLTIATAELPDAIRGKLGASDIVQETILKGFENYDKFHGTTREEFAGWLRTILINQIASIHKSYRSQKRDLNLEVNADSRLFNPSQRSPCEVALTQEQNGVLEAALSQLPDDYREVILLRHRENLTFTEIGIHLQKSEDAVRKIWTRAVKQLKQELQRHESKAL